MSDNLLPPKGRVKIYACGGAGINIGYHYEGARDIDGFPELSITYVDTSRSNAKPGMRPESLYVIHRPDGEELDGSGKIRRENAQHIESSIKQVLQKHAPEQFNIVVFSNSGGSGSVVGPILMGELLARGETVVGVVVGSDESQITCQNAVNTFKSLEGIAKRNKRSLVINYSHWARGTSRADTDSHARYAITALSVLMSRQFAELDSKDLVNWLDTTKVGIAPQLSVLQITSKAEEVDVIKAPVSIASLLTDAEQKSYTVRPQYSCVGYGNIPLDGRDSLHFVISVDAVADIYKAVEHDTNELVQASQAHLSRSSLISDSDIESESGMFY